MGKIDMHLYKKDGSELKRKDFDDVKKNLFALVDNLQKSNTRTKCDRTYKLLTQTIDMLHLIKCCEFFNTEV